MQETEAAVAPKCEEEGKTAVLTCANGCGKTEGGDPVDELGHDMQKSADAVAATCEAPGKTEVKTCANGCGKTEGGEPVDALGHDMQKTADAVAATCENPGTTAVYTCSRGCGHQTGGETVDALGHTSGDPERTNVVEAKCGVPGSYDMVQKCTACGAVTNTVSHEIPALEHILEMTQEAVSPDCENPGTTAVYTCSRGCGYSEGGETLKALGHDMQETEAAVAPKCEEEGKTAVLTCANGCGKTEGGETVEATGHKNTIVVNAKDATCGEAGYTGDTYCNDCQKTVKNGETIDATGDHSYDDGVYTDPTFEADGYTTYTCGVCKGTKVDTDEGSMLTAVAQIGEQKFQTLAAAIEAAAANEAAETIELLSKAVITEDTTWDLGEDTLSFFAESGENYGLVIKAHLTVNGGAYVTNSLFGIGVNPNGTLTVNGGEFRCAGDSDYLIGSWGTTAINGGTFNGQYNCVNAFEGTLTVTGGTFSTAETDYSGEYESADILGDGKVTVTGGTYSKEVDASFLAEGYCVAEAEGKYDVAKHSYNEKVTDPTCTADGYTTYTCQRCGDTYDVTDEGSMIAHSFTNYVSNKDATCTADGTKTAKCDNCDATDTVTDADSKLDHPTTEVRDAKNATCTEEGYTGDTWCTTCNTKIADGTATDKAPHTEETVPAVPATCMAPGATAGVKCTVCLEILSGCEETAQLEHEDTDSDHICNNGCNAKISECDFTVCGEVVTEANCVTEAVYKAVCSVCGAVSETETITGEVDSAKHTGNTEVRDAKDATCVAEGYTGDTWCKDCNTKTATGEAIEKLTTHSYPDTWTEVQAPTCTEKGSEKRECTVEGCDSFETREIAATGEHVDSDGDNKCDGCGMDIGEEEPDVSAKPQVTAKSLLLEGMVSVKVYLGFTDADGQNFDINYVLEHGGLEVTCVDGTVVDCNELKKSSIYAGIQEYTAETPGIPAKDMDKALILRPYIVIDGEKVYGEATEYGVLNYAENMIQKSTTNAETKATIVGLLKYGAAAQKYFDNQKNNSYVAPEILMDACLDTFVANGWLGADVLELNWNAEWITAVVEPEAEMTVNFVQKDSSIRCTGKSLLLNGAISINYYMSVGEDSTNFEGCSATLYQWTGADYQKLQNSGEILTKNNATYTTTVTPKFTYTSGYGWECKVASEQIPAKEFGDTFYAVMCFTDKDGNEHYTNVVVYSPEAYANSKLNSSDSTLVELVKWMVAYGERARIKFGN